MCGQKRMEICSSYKLCIPYRTVFDLAKTAPNLMLLQQESNGLDIIFFMGVTPRVSDMQSFLSFYHVLVVMFQDTFSMLIEKNGKSLIPPPWEVNNAKCVMKS